MIVTGNPKGYILLRKKIFNKKGAYVKKEWVGMRILKACYNLGLKSSNEMLSRVRINNKPLSRWKLFFGKLKNGDSIDLSVNPKGSKAANAFFNFALLVVGAITLNPTLAIAGATGLVATILTKNPREEQREKTSRAISRPEITGASNEISRSIVPIHFGNIKYTFKYGQNYLRYTGDGTATNKFYQYFIAGYKNIELSDSKFGNTDISEFGSNVTETIVYGSSSYIGYNNIKQLAKDEQLTVDESTVVNDILVTDEVVNSSGNCYVELEWTSLPNITDFSDKKIQIRNISNGSSTQVTITYNDITATYSNPFDAMTDVDAPSGNECWGGADSWKIFDQSNSNSFTTTGTAYVIRNTDDDLSKIELTMASGTYDFDIVYTEDTMPSPGSDVSGLSYTVVGSFTSQSFSALETKSYLIDTIPSTATGWGIYINGQIYQLNGFKIDSFNYTSSAIHVNPGNFDFVKAELKNIFYTQNNQVEIDSNLECECLSFQNASETITNEEFNYLAGSVNYVVDTTSDNTEQVEWNFAFPQGLFKQESDGSKSGRQVAVLISFKLDSSSTYLNLEDADAIFVKDIDDNKYYLTDPGDGIYVNANTTTYYNSNNQTIVFDAPAINSVIDELFFRNIGIEVTSGQYNYKLSSTGALISKSDKDYGTISIADINSYVEGDAVNPDILSELTQVSVEAIAFKNLSGTLQQYNAIVDVEIPVWDGYDWDSTDFSTNPAAIVRYLLTNENVNPRAQSVDTLDNDSFVEFYNFCETEGYSASGVIDDPQKIKAVIDTILDNHQAVLTGIDGKFAISIDKEKNVNGMITPHNSWNNEISYSIGEKTNALRFKFINRDGFKEDELTLYYYSGAVHETLDSGMTDKDFQIVKKEIDYTLDRDSIVKNGTYKLKTIQERLREATFNVNLEGLGMQIYDKIKYSDTSRTGERYSGRIKEVYRNGSNLVTGFKLKQSIDLGTPTSYYKIYIRSILDYGDGTGDFEVVGLDISESSTKTDTVTLLTPYDDGGIIKGAESIKYVEAYGFYDGDLFDISDNKILDMVITDIKPDSDLTAKITALETSDDFWS